MNEVSARPIGIFDSGVGGLSVAVEVRRALPAEDLVYVADAAHCPYGDRPAAEVRERALHYLVDGLPRDFEEVAVSSTDPGPARVHRPK